MGSDEAWGREPDRVLRGGGAVDANGSTGLSMSARHRVYLALQDMGEGTRREIVERVGLPRGAVIDALKNLFGAGYVERCGTDHEHRAVYCRSEKEYRPAGQEREPQKAGLEYPLSEVKRAILALVGERGEMTSESISRAMDMALQATRIHVDALMRRGLLSGRKRDGHHTAKIYRLPTVAAPQVSAPKVLTPAPCYRGLTNWGRG